jgi:hypothetical protein
MIIRKIRIDEPNPILANNFGTTTHQCQKNFRQHLPAISELLYQFVYWPDSDDIKYQFIQSAIDKLIAFKFKNHQKSDCKQHHGPVIKVPIQSNTLFLQHQVVITTTFLVDTVEE